jgi:signal transduction histidine kinase
VKRSIKARITYAISLIVLLTVAILSLLSNYFINKQFTDYISRQMDLKIQVITSSLGEQYNSMTREWNPDYVQAIGMSSLYEGYIIKVYDDKNRTVWDAQAHDMSLCKVIMDNISERMRIKYPNLNGEFVSTKYNIIKGKVVIGTVSISYFGPFFLNDNEFRFLSELNTILIMIGLAAIALSILAGHLIAKRISRPILHTVEAAKEIADGNYGVRLEQGSDTREVGMLTESINHLATSLQNLEKLRKQLTSDVAHELRTPISILQSHIEAMMEGVWQPTTERMQSCYDETVRIGKLVNDLEKLAKIESGSIKLEMTEVNLKEILQKTVDSFEKELINKNLAAAVSGPDITVWADRDRITQVIVNLLTNAVKYSRDAGLIRFETLEDEKYTGFLIRDQGIGIPEEELPYIFERFYRADKSRNRLTGGSGIGLTIVKSIVEAHAGTVKAESKINEGSTFTVLLPRKS